MHGLQIHLAVFFPRLKIPPSSSLVHWQLVQNLVFISAP